MVGNGFDVDDMECMCFQFSWSFGLCLLVIVWGLWICGEVSVEGCDEGRASKNRRLTCWRASIMISFGAKMDYFI